MPFRDCDSEVGEIGWLKFLEKAMAIREQLPRKERDIIEAIDHESLSWSKFMETRSQADWLNFVGQVEYHRLYPEMRSFSDDYYKAVCDALDIIKEQKCQP